jgi:hypothetical protein
VGVLVQLRVVQIRSVALVVESLITDLSVLLLDREVTAVTELLDSKALAVVVVLVLLE